MLTDLIEERIEFVYGAQNTKSNTSKLPNQDWSLNNKFFKQYGIVVTEAKKHNVSSFLQIGLLDPYPEEKLKSIFTMPLNQDDLIYPQSRYIYK